MKLLLCVKDYCYYDYNGELIFIKNLKPFTERTYKSRLKYLTSKGELE